MAFLSLLVLYLTSSTWASAADPSSVHNTKSTSKNASSPSSSSSSSSFSSHRVNIEPLPWSEAIQKAKLLVAKLSFQDKIDLVTGLGWQVTPCVGNIPAKPAINFPGLCLQDSPTGVRYADEASAFPASM